jgi:hypothetical protein
LSDHALQKFLKESLMGKYVPDAGIDAGPLISPLGA